MTKKIISIYSILLMFAAAAVLFIGTIFHTQTAATEDNQTIIELAGQISTLENGFTFTTTLPEQLSSLSHLGFNLIHQEVKVYLQGTLYYSYVAGDNPFGRSPGNSWQFIPLPEHAEGSELTIVVTSPYSVTASMVPTFYLGSHLSLVGMVFERGFPVMLFSVLTLVAGIFLSTYYFFMLIRIQYKSNLLFLGIFAIILAIWGINESDILLVLYNNNLVFSNISFLSLMLLPVPFLLFIKDFYHEPQHPIWYFVSSCSLAVCIINLVLQLTNLFDFRETVYLSLGVLILSVLSIFYMTARELRRFGFSDQIRLHIIFGIISMVALLIYIITYICTGVTTGGVLGLFSIFFYIMVLGINSMRNSAKLIHKGKEADFYRNLADTDQLTGLYNHSALLRHLETISPQSGSTAFAIFDLNDLKECNDTYGHLAGDQFISASGTAIFNAFHHLGNCYRMGGDEFCVLVSQYNHELIEAAFQQLEKGIGALSASYPMIKQLGLAYGYAVYNANQDFSIKDTIRRADIMMYENKINMKKKLILKNDVIRINQTE